jgi:hypothetical protein
MNTYVVSVANDADRDVEAEYFVNEDGFTTFKDDKHKQVASFSNAHIVGIVRAATKSRSVGTVHVTIVPKLDSAAFERTLAEAQERIAQATSSPPRHAPDCSNGSKCGSPYHCPNW